VSRFRSEKAAIEADTSLTPEERSRAVDQLLQSNFSSPEQIRVHAILGDAPSAP
jgi:lipase chaperone LimK